LVNTFSFFYRNYIEKHYYQLSFRQIDERDQWSLKNQFDDVDILLSEDQKENKTLIKETDRKKLIDLIDKGYQFHGYEKGIYDYVKFDTYTEKQFADYANEVLKPEDNEARPFWVKNDRNIFFTYGRKRYYPDFIMFYKGIIYVVETKGELYSDIKKNLLLEKLNDFAGYKSILVYSDFLNKQDVSEVGFEDFVNVAQRDAVRRQTKESLVQEVAEEDKFKKYIPVYSPENAFRKFSKSANKVKLEGWLEVPMNKEGYPESYFVTQIRGEALSPKISSYTKSR
jgi:type III restriction enzyme